MKMLMGDFERPALENSSLLYLFGFFGSRACSQNPESAWKLQLDLKRVPQEVAEL